MVLVRIGKENIWECDIYSHFRENDAYPHRTLKMRLKDENILPYEGNEHLVGTTDEPEEEIKLEEGEWIMCASEISNNASDWALRQHSLTKETVFLVATGGFWSYAIRFSDFNPNDMEETRKNILCIKNGKIIRYKG